MTDTTCRRLRPSASSARLLSPDQQTKQNPSELAAVEFSIWQLQWAVESKLVHTS